MEEGPSTWGSVRNLDAGPHGIRGMRREVTEEGPSTWGSARNLDAGHHGTRVMEVMAGASSAREKTRNSGAGPAVLPFLSLPCLYYLIYGVELEIPSVRLYSHLQAVLGEGYEPPLAVVLVENPRALGSRHGLLLEGS